MSERWHTKLDNVRYKGKRVKIYPRNRYLISIEGSYPPVEVDGKTLIEFASKYYNAKVEVIGKVK
jgi:hypothetical protein